VAGADKAAILARLMQGDQSLPAARLQPSGELWVFRDAAAGGGS
jgi:6-phosphogluconolactonase/glucosamine-6-phosphate isomerase/deaminase